MKGSGLTLYKTNNGIEIYETVDDLLQKDITEIWGYGGKYYVSVKSDNFYDNRIWIVDKKTKQVSKGYYIDIMLDIADKATPVDPETLRRGCSKTAPKKEK